MCCAAVAGSNLVLSRWDNWIQGVRRFRCDFDGLVRAEEGLGLTMVLSLRIANRTGVGKRDWGIVQVEQWASAEVGIVSWTNGGNFARVLGSNSTFGEDCDSGRCGKTVLASDVVILPSVMGAPKWLVKASSEMMLPSNWRSCRLYFCAIVMVVSVGS